MLRLLLGDPIEWDLALVLEAEEVPPLRLDGNGRLGWTTWLASRSRTEPADDLVLRPVRAAA